MSIKLFKLTILFAFSLLFASSSPAEEGELMPDTFITGRTEGGIKTYFLSMDGGRVEMTFTDFNSPCAGFEATGLRTSSGGSTEIIPWKEIKYLVLPAASGMLKNGKQFKSRRISDKNCIESSISGELWAKVKIRMFKNPQWMKEDINIAMKDIRIMAFNKKWLNEGVEAYMSMATAAGGIKTHILRKNDSREKITFTNFDSPCLGFKGTGIKTSSGESTGTIPWKEIKYLVLSAASGMLKKGDEFKFGLIKDKTCADSFISGELWKNVIIPKFKKPQWVSEDINIPLKDVEIIAFDEKWLNEGVEAYRRMATEEMVFMPGACFDMGAGDGYEDETPAHRVCVDDYYMGKYEVNQRQWWKVMGRQPSHFNRCPECPVENVSWNDVSKFLEKLNQNKGTNYRLPSEAEWEYAARSGGKSDKWAGTSDESKLGEIAWHGTNSKSLTHPLGEKGPNGLEIYDMTGNVSEWVSDWYLDDYYKRSPNDNPAGPLIGSYRVFRGGSFYNEPKYMTNSFRFSAGPEYKDRAIGFRLARTPELQ